MLLQTEICPAWRRKPATPNGHGSVRARSSSTSILVRGMARRKTKNPN